MHRHRGWTILELAVAILVLGILLQIAVPSLATWRNREAARAAARKFRADLARARTSAVMRGETIAVQLDTLAPGYAVRTLAGDTLFERSLEPVLALRTTAHLQRVLFTARGTGSLYATTWIAVRDDAEARWLGTRVTPTGAIEVR